MGQIILAVDDSGKFLGYIPKEEGHKGKGKRHLAIAVLLFNSKGQVLLQKRKHKIFDNIWDLTGATHPLHKPHPCHPEPFDFALGKLAKDLPWSGKIPRFARNDRECKICNQDNADETLEEATRRCLESEWHVRDVRDIKKIGVFNYFAPYQAVQGDFCENEHCFLMVVKYDGKVSLNPQSGYEYKWVKRGEFLKDIATNPQKYTPWAIYAVKLLKQAKFTYGS